DERVSLDELARYVTANVERWARLNRGVRQTPQLLARDRGKAKEIELARYDQKALPGPEEPNVPEYPPWLADGWKLRDSWWDDQTFQVAPLAFADLQATLLHAEQRWRGRNVPAAEPEREVRERRAALEKQVAAARGSIPRPARPRSLALAAAFG